MWTHSIRLPISKQETLDEDGFPVDGGTMWLTGIPATFTSLTRGDRELAGQLGYDASVNIGIMACNYSGQRYLEDEADGTRYYIQRTYQPDKSSMITLTVGRREHGGNF